MCNDYEQHVRFEDYKTAMQHLGLQVPDRQSELDLPRADDIRIGDIGPVMRMVEDNIADLEPMTFGLPPKGKGGPVFNFRSEGRRFAKMQRCLVVASAFFEFTGKKYPKAKHRFTLKASPITAIAGLWRVGSGNRPASFAMLTTEPGPDVAPIHDRQIVVLRPQDWKDWLQASKPEEELLCSLPEGSFGVEQVRADNDG